MPRPKNKTITDKAFTELAHATETYVNWLSAVADVYGIPRSRILDVASAVMELQALLWEREGGEDVAE